MHSSLVTSPSLMPPCSKEKIIPQAPDDTLPSSSLQPAGAISRSSWRLGLAALATAGGGNGGMSGAALETAVSGRVPTETGVL